MNTDRESVRRRMAQQLDLPVNRLHDEARLSDLVTSSFALVELIIELQEEYQRRFGQSEMQGVIAVGQLIDLYCAPPTDDTGSKTGGVSS